MKFENKQRLRDYSCGGLGTIIGIYIFGFYLLPILFAWLVLIGFVEWNIYHYSRKGEAQNNETR